MVPFDDVCFVRPMPAPSFRWVLVSLALAPLMMLAAGCDETPEPAPPRDPVIERIDTALVRGGAFLRGQQGDDGGFHSPTYGSFRDGRAVTPLVLMALWIVPGADAEYRRGVDFVANGSRDVVGYPVYTLAGSLLVLGMPRNERHRAKIAPFAEALRSHQRQDGGWGVLTDQPSNLSTTLFAIGALRLAGTAAHDAALVRAARFVEQCQNFPAQGERADPRFDDGGFFYSPTVTDGNKAGAAGPDATGQMRFRSYGSMSADGVRALMRLGRDRNDARVQAGARWLVRNFSAERNPGEFEEVNEVRRESAYYYYAWSVAHAMRALGEREWARPLANELLSRQRADGAWSNRFTEMREDDPLVATSFAIASLAIVRSVLSGESRSHASDRGR